MTQQPLQTCCLQWSRCEVEFWNLLVGRRRRKQFVALAIQTKKKRNNAFFWIDRPENRMTLGNNAWDILLHASLTFIFSYFMTCHDLYSWFALQSERAFLKQIPFHRVSFLGCLHSDRGRIMIRSWTMSKYGNQRFVPFVLLCFCEITRRQNFKTVPKPKEDVQRISSN